MQFKQAEEEIKRLEGLEKKDGRRRRSQYPTLATESTSFKSTSQDGDPTKTKEKVKSGEKQPPKAPAPRRMVNLLEAVDQMHNKKTQSMLTAATAEQAPVKLAPATSMEREEENEGVSQNEDPENVDSTTQPVRHMHTYTHTHEHRCITG